MNSNDTSARNTNIIGNRNDTGYNPLVDLRDSHFGLVSEIRDLTKVIMEVDKK